MIGWWVGWHCLGEWYARYAVGRYYPLPILRLALPPHDDPNRCGEVLHGQVLVFSRATPGVAGFEADLADSWEAALTAGMRDLTGRARYVGE